MVNACLYLQKTGCPWRYLPKDFGAGEAVRSWKDLIRADGVWGDAAAVLTRAVRPERGHSAEPRAVILDSQSVASGPQAGERGVDGNKRVKRGIAERTVACLNQCRRLAKDWEGRSRSALAFLPWASIQLMLRRPCQKSQYSRI